MSTATAKAKAKQERPILFSGEMVKAILDGRKRQTRRIVSLLPHWVGDLTHDDLDRGGFWNAWTGTGHQWQYGDERLRQNYQVGDLLWVRETFCDNGGGEYEYKATSYSHAGSWSPSIFMPRRASRITLEITGIRVERLQQISSEDAMAEGVNVPRWNDRGVLEAGCLDARSEFQRIWDRINGKKAPWVSNPWTWVIEFKRLEVAA